MPFGESFVEQQANTGFSNPYKFTGHELDKQTGLYYAKARFYSPKRSIFLSVNPLAEKYPSFGGYTYCLNNPINAIDSDGRDVIVLYDTNAVHKLGHSAVLIGNDKNGWRYVSMNGTGEGASPIGTSRNADIGNIKGQNDFRGTGLTAKEVIKKINTSNPNEEHNYDKFVRIASNTTEDAKAYEYASKEASSKWYNVCGQSCIEPGQGAIRGVMEERYGKELVDKVFGIIDNQLVPNNQSEILSKQVKALTLKLEKLKSQQQEVNKTPSSAQKIDKVTQQKIDDWIKYGSEEDRTP